MQIVYVVTSSVSECDINRWYDLNSATPSVMQLSVFSYFSFMLFIYYPSIYLVFKFGARGGSVCRGTALQAGMLRALFLMASLEFFIDIVLPAAL